MKTKPELVWPVVFLRALGAMEPKEKTLKIHHQEIVDNNCYLVIPRCLSLM